jgi:mannose-6-phosphate isomerase
MALDAIDYTKNDDFKVAYNQEANKVNTMIDCKYFSTNFIHLTEDLKQDVSLRDSFTIFMCVQGKVTVENEYGSAQIQKGETVLVSANSGTIVLKSSGAKLLEVTI